MSAAKHTPGPWRVVGSLGQGMDVEASDGTAVCVPFLANGAIEANCRLIAAAPDLLDALQLAAREMRAMRSAVGAGLLTDKAVAAADAAIAKATGAAA